ncbi:hypothetical protein KEM54_002341 [Ascosphaera aggregata]|nr:hypothetical protein KEM54_002341 [Ascosphaera aggregata]
MSSNLSEQRTRRRVLQPFLATAESNSRSMQAGMVLLSTQSGLPWSAIRKMPFCQQDVPHAQGSDEDHHNRSSEAGNVFGQPMTVAASKNETKAA